MYIKHIHDFVISVCHIVTWDRGGFGLSCSWMSILISHSRFLHNYGYKHALMSHIPQVKEPEEKCEVGNHLF